MIAIVVSCDVIDCRATAKVEVGSGAEHYDAELLFESLEDGQRLMFVVDTGWLNSPDGWTVGPGAGGQSETRCPAHPEVPK